MDDLGDTSDALSCTDQEGRAWLALLSLLVSDNQNLCPAEMWVVLQAAKAPAQRPGGREASLL